MVYKVITIDNMKSYYTSGSPLGRTSGRLVERTQKGLEEEGDLVLFLVFPGPDLIPNSISLLPTPQTPVAEKSYPSRSQHTHVHRIKSSLG